MKRKKDIVDIEVKQNKNKKNPLRLPEVDLLKAAAALLVVLIHVTARYRNDSDLMYFFWDYIHFAVASFVLASGYLFQNKPPTINNVRDYFAFLWKKFKRVVIPYYIFALVFSVAVVLFGEKELTKVLDVGYILDTIFLWGGAGNNWIPLLFMGIMVLQGIESWLNPRFPQFKYLLFTFALSISIFQMTRETEFLSNFDRIFGWLVIFYIGRYLYGRMELRRVLKIWLFSFLLFLSLHYLFGVIGLDQGIFNNKYPPNFYYLSYQVTATLPLFYLLYKYSHTFLRSKRVWAIIAFIAASSYEIFFYHLLIMEFWKKEINWIVDWALITSATVGILYTYRTIQKKFFLKEK